MRVRNNPKALAILHDAKVKLAEVLGYAVMLEIKPKQVLQEVDPFEWVYDVCSALEISVPGVFGDSRKRELIIGRQMIIYFLYKHSGMSQEEIAYLLKYKDHTTVVHHIREVENLIKVADSTITEAYLKCYQQLKKYATITEQV